MELTSKQRAQLRGLANTIDTIVQVGKDGIGENLIKQVDEALEARELIKGRVLDNNIEYDARLAAEELAKATRSEVVQVIGTKFVIYRFSEKLQEQRNLTGRAKRKETPSGKKNPVRKGAQARRQAAKKVREQRNEYFRQQAIDKAIERSRERQLKNKD
jgi:RNA-binding protein